MERTLARAAGSYFKSRRQILKTTIRNVEILNRNKDFISEKSHQKWTKLVQAKNDRTGLTAINLKTDLNKCGTRRKSKSMKRLKLLFSFR